MWQLTGFADEVSKDFAEQLELMKKLGIKNIEFRSAWDTKILDLSDEQLDKAKGMLDEAGISVSALGSDLGKIVITEPFEDHLERVKHAMDVTKKLGTKNIRMFSFFMPEGETDYSPYRDEVMKRSKAMVEVAEAAGVTLLHENEKGIYGDTPERVKDLLDTMNSENYKPIFDPANYVQTDVKPFDDAYPLVGKQTAYVHIKDAKFVDDSVVPAGEGDGQVKEVLDQLRKDGYTGFLSIEPHLGDFDAFGGLCGPDLWTDAFNALNKILNELKIDWK